MNIAKHMEAIFVAAVALVAATGIATAGAPAAQPAGMAATAFVGKMQVVTIVGKRMSAEEKAATAE